MKAEAIPDVPNAKPNKKTMAISHEIE